MCIVCFKGSLWGFLVNKVFKSSILHILHPSLQAICLLCCFFWHITATFRFMTLKKKLFNSVRGETLHRLPLRKPVWPLLYISNLKEEWLRF